MKLKKAESKNYICDSCGAYRKHIQMYNEAICYDCYDKEGELTPLKAKEKKR